MSAAQAWSLAATLAVAAILAGIGGELFVRAVVGMAERWRMSKLLVAMTIAACATSAPEMMVAVVASANGNSALAMGGALGSNVTNLMLILGVALLFGSMTARMDELRWHLAAVLAAPLAAFALLADGMLSRWEGALLLLAFSAWLVFTVISIQRTRGLATETPDPGAARHPLALLCQLAGGVATLVVAGHLFVEGGRTMAHLFGVPESIIGATVVALGTSMPELMTTLVARWRGQQDVGLGTLLGSNLFNGLAILGTAALIAPVDAPRLATWGMLLFGLFAVLLVIPRGDSLGRGRGGLLLVSYAMYVAVLGWAPGFHDAG